MVLTLSHIASLLLTVIFTLLGVLHFYWAAGGKRWIDVAVPEIKGKPTFSPPPFLTVVVAVGLLAFGALAFFLGFMNPPAIPNWFLYGGWVAAGIFLIRAIGDFKRVGFFKSRADRTGFARNDSRIYSPLCLFISLSFILINLA